MLWLTYVFYALMLVMGAAAFVLYRRAMQPARAWIWLAVSLLGAAGLGLVLTGHVEGYWRSRALGVMFPLFALDHVVQYQQSRKAGSPKAIQLFLAAVWIGLAVLQFVDLPGDSPS